MHSIRSVRDSIIASKIGKRQQPLGVGSPATLHLANSPSSSPLKQSGFPSHNLSRKIGRMNPNSSGFKQLVIGFEGFHLHWFIKTEFDTMIIYSNHIFCGEKERTLCSTTLILRFESLS